MSDIERLAGYLATLNEKDFISFCTANNLNYSEVSPIEFNSYEDVYSCLSLMMQYKVWLGSLMMNGKVWGMLLKHETEERYHDGIDLIMCSPNPLEAIIYFRGCYRLGFPALADNVFDFLEKLYIGTFPSLSYLNEITYDDDEYSVIVKEALKMSHVKRARSETVTKQFDPTKYPQYMDLNSEKSFSIKPIVDPKEAFEFWKNSPMCRVQFSLKIDGVNVKMAFSDSSDKGFELALSRGRATNSLDYTETMLTYMKSHNIEDKTISGRVTGEACVLLDDLKVIQSRYVDKDYKTPKSTALAMLRAPSNFESEDLSKLTFFAFNYNDKKPDVAFKELEEAGFVVPPHLEFPGEDIPRTSLEDFNIWMDKNVLQPLLEAGSNLGVGSDGVVMYLLADINTERKDKYSDSNIAIKYGPWLATTYKSRVVKIICEQKRVEASIVLVIEPVITRDFNTATRVGVGSPDILMKDGVHVGDLIEFERKSEAYNVYLKRLEG